jgi:hypothetical protein
VVIRKTGVLKRPLFLCHRHFQTKQPKPQEIKALPNNAKISVAQKWQRNLRPDQGILVAENLDGE